MKKRNIFIIVGLLLLILFDQLSKLLVTNNINLNEDIVLIPKFLNITYVENYGAAFGILQGKRIFFIIITFLALGYLVYEIIKCKNIDLYLISLLMISGGIIGNFIDRLFYGYVRDFISFKIFNPVFNLADSFIVIGAILYVISVFLEERYGSKRKLDRK